MTPTDLKAIPLGHPVHTHTTLTRRSGRYVPTPLPAPASGVYVGYRTVSNGAFYDYPTSLDRTYEPNYYFQVGLVVTDLRRDPLKVRPEDIELLPPQGIEAL